MVGSVTVLFLMEGFAVVMAMRLLKIFALVLAIEARNVNVNVNVIYVVVVVVVESTLKVSRVQTFNEYLTVKAQLLEFTLGLRVIEIA